LLWCKRRERRAQRRCHAIFRCRFSFLLVREHSFIAHSRFVLIDTVAIFVACHHFFDAFFRCYFAAAAFLLGCYAAIDWRLPVFHDSLMVASWYDFHVFTFLPLFTPRLSLLDTPFATDFAFQLFSLIISLLHALMISFPHHPPAFLSFLIFTCHSPLSFFLLPPPPFTELHRPDCHRLYSPVHCLSLRSSPLPFVHRFTSHADYRSPLFHYLGSYRHHHLTSSFPPFFDYCLPAPPLYMRHLPADISSAPLIIITHHPTSRLP